MTKAESGKIELHPEPYPPEEFRQYIDAVIRPCARARTRRFTLEMDMPEGLRPRFDKLRINQIVFNLLSNAVKYTPEGGTIRLYGPLLRGAARRPARSLDPVADNGVGMSGNSRRCSSRPSPRRPGTTIPSSGVRAWALPSPSGWWS
jgi:K+-sensing histidine kinase KdpD